MDYPWGSELIWIKNIAAISALIVQQPIATAPFARGLELAVIGYGGVDPLLFPCRRILGGWVKAETI
jgi:hypothetical protein